MWLLRLALAAAAAGIVPAGLPAAGGEAVAAAKAPPSYRGTWFGTTAAGGEIDFTVNRRNRITVVELDYEIEGDDCVARVEDRVRGPIRIQRRAFQLELRTKQETLTLTGRFGSRTRAAGRLRATATDEDGCTGSISTRWQARKGKRPAVDRTHDGTWSGSVSLPGIDPALLAQVGGVFFEVERGAISTASVPAVIRGAGCQTVRIPGLGEAYEPPVPIRDRAFEVTGEDGSWRFTLAGAFSSPTTASGTVTIEGSQLIVGVPFPTSCSGRIEGTWEAARATVGRTLGAPAGLARTLPPRP